MPELHVRNLPTELYEQLRELAAAEGRSMSAQAIVLLRRSLGSGEVAPSGRAVAVERLRDIRRCTRLPAGTPAAEQIIRADRDVAR